MATATSQQRTLVVVVTIVATLIGAHYLGITAPLERLTVRALEPIGRTAVRLLGRTSEPARYSKAELKQKLPELEQRIADLSAENVQLRASLDAVVESSNQQRFTESRKFPGVLGRMFARSADPGAEYITIDVGSSSGVRGGSPVIVHDGILIGKVQSVRADSSRILLNTDNRSSFTGVSANNPNAQGVVSGVRGLSLRMDLIPQNETLPPGEIIVTDGTDKNIPRGLLLGQVGRIERQPGALFQSAALSTLYDVARLDVVTVITADAP